MRETLKTRDHQSMIAAAKELKRLLIGAGRGMTSTILLKMIGLNVIVPAVVDVYELKNFSWLACIAMH